VTTTHLGSLVAVSFACALTWGCHTHDSPPIRPSEIVFGSGKVVTESRPVSGFTAISVSGGARLVVVQSGVEALSVTAEDNILPLVRTAVVGGRLVLGLAPGTNLGTTREILFEVTAHTLSAIDASGATRVELAGLETDTFSLQASGASRITGSGAARALQLELSGEVRCDLERLASRSAVTTVSGTSYARLRVADSLAATASGVSLVEYFGDPVVVANVSGASAVRRLGS
jgi:hypothetical protein